MPGFKLLSILFFALGCSSTNIKVESAPGQANVYVQSVQNGERIKLGQTPMEISKDQLSQYSLEKGPLYLVMDKTGYSEHKILLSEVSGVEIEVRHNLKPTINLESEKEINDLVEDLFEVQRLIRVRDYDGALKMIDDLAKKAPLVGAIYELKGAIYYINEDYVKALEAYRNVLKTPTKSGEAKRMIGLLEKKLAGGSSE
ncbi:MAG: hypothetical protein VX642_01865 [Bdellovibrionota bacterium]|nr:hypothetical protein [Bdellovibrionota bacterium]